MIECKTLTSRNLAAKSKKGDSVEMSETMKLHDFNDTLEQPNFDREIAMGLSERQRNTALQALKEASTKTKKNLEKT